MKLLTAADIAIKRVEQLHDDHRQDMKLFAQEINRLRDENARLVADIGPLLASVSALDAKQAATRKDLRKALKTLRVLSENVLAYLWAMDAYCARNTAIPKEASSEFAILSNALEMANDLARNAVGLAITPAEKAAALKRMQKR